MEEQLNIADNVSAVINAKPKERRQKEEILEKDQAQAEFKKITVPVEIHMFEELKEYLDRRCAIMKVSFDDVISSLVYTGAFVNYNKGCPYCLQTKKEKEKRRKENLKNALRKEKEKRKRQRKSGRRARKNQRT